MLSMDLAKFWDDDKAAHIDNCFNKEAAQVALGIRMSDECVFAELGVDGDQWGQLPSDIRIRYNKAYNDKAEKIVGIRPLSETYPEEDAKFPRIKRIGEVFGGQYDELPNAGEWLHSDIKTVAELDKMLDRVEKLNIREFILPDHWEAEKERIHEQYGRSPSHARYVRGPVTLAMSLFGEENLIYLYYDEPELFQRFSQLIGTVIIEIGDIMDAEAYGGRQNAPHGFWFYDDNCSLLTPEMYEIFGYPVLKQVFEHFSPNGGDTRYQHSDSEMAHLLPILGRLNLTGCNFGPTVLADEIRRHMPKTRIDGCIAPFTFMNNNPDEILREVRRDCEMIKKTGTRGLNIQTAGSINNGSSLESMRTVMYGIQLYGQY